MKLRNLKESYSNIDYENVWNAYDIAEEQLGCKELALSLAKGMGTDMLVNLLRHIFNDWEIPFYDEEEDYWTEGCHRNTKQNLKESRCSLADDIVQLVGRNGFWTRENEFIEDIEGIGATVEDINYEYADIQTEDEECIVYFNRGGNSFTISKIKCYDEDGNSFWYNELEDDEDTLEESFNENDDLEDLIQEFEQEYDSSVTSINSAKLPTIFSLVQKLGGFKQGTMNLDFGGGKFDNVAQYLKDYDVLNLVYDPFNRSKEHNKDVIDFVKKNGGADTVTCSNVLNVIKEPENRLSVIKNCDRLVKSDGTVYFTVYEGSGSGEGKANDKRKSYQTNMKTKDYQEELEKVFSSVTRKGKLFICK